MIFVYTFLGGAAVLAYWAGVLWLGARADRKHLAREQAIRMVGDRDRG